MGSSPSQISISPGAQPQNKEENLFALGPAKAFWWMSEFLKAAEDNICDRWRPTLGGHTGYRWFVGLTVLYVMVTGSKSEIIFCRGKPALI